MTAAGSGTAAALRTVREQWVSECGEGVERMQPSRQGGVAMMALRPCLVACERSLRMVAAVALRG